MSTIGILINHYDARNDIRDLVAELSRRHKVVLLGPAGSVHPAHLAPGVEFRPCQKTRPIRRRLLEQLYRFFGFIPKSKENFYINELFKLERLSRLRRLIPKAALLVRMHAPFRINPENFLAGMSACDRTLIDDIDGFLLLTEFSDNALTARIVASGKPTCAYVYSWDHPCKHTVMTKGIRRYAVWNSQLVGDMVELQGIPKEACAVVGATQLVPIHEFLQNAGLLGAGTIEGKPYFYFGCGVGPVALARQEMEVVRRLAAAMRRRAPDHLLLVRPYPMGQGVDLRPMLGHLDNVRWDDDFKASQIGRSLGSTDIERRIALQHGSKAFFHIGTTMGFEGSFIGVPCVLLRPPKGDESSAREFDKLTEFAAQYHLHRHLVKGVNYVGIEPGELEQAVDKCAKGWPELVRDSRAVAADTPLRPMGDIADHLAQLSLAG